MVLFVLGLLIMGVIDIELRLLRYFLRKLIKNRVWYVISLFFIFMGIAGVSLYFQLILVWEHVLGATLPRTIPQPLGFGLYVGMMSIYLLEYPKENTIPKRKWIGYIQENAEGRKGYINVRLKNLPLQIQISSNKKRMYPDQSNELCNFLEEKITEKNYNNIINNSGINFTVKTSVPPYLIDIETSYENKDGVLYDDFFSDILDSIKDLYRRNKIKP